MTSYLRDRGAPKWPIRNRRQHCDDVVLSARQRPNELDTG